MDSRTLGRTSILVGGALAFAAALAGILGPRVSGAEGSTASRPPAGASTPTASARAAGADTIRFRHEDHSALDCAECHATGEPTVAGRTDWCADCHHVSARVGECARCHGTARVRREPVSVLYTFRFSVGEAKTRRLTFEHATHSELACGECHTGGAPAEVGRSCGSCHEPHHRLEADCLACHAEPRSGAHSEEVHRQGCGGSDCHAVAELETGRMASTRNLCLVCHQAQRDHEPDGVCAKCHLLGERRTAAPARGRE